MKGELHTRLRAYLQQAWKAGAFVQDSLSASMEKSQRSVSQYLNGEKDAGALDLDEAEAALMHVGSNLRDFLAGLPPRDLTPIEAVTRQLATRPELAALVEDLLRVPKRKLAGVIELTRGLAHVASPTRGAQKSESTSGHRRGRRTTKAPTPRR